MVATTERQPMTSWWSPRFPVLEELCTQLDLARWSKHANITIDNTLNANRVGNLEFTDNLPNGMVIAILPMHRLIVSRLRPQTPQSLRFQGNPHSRSMPAEALFFLDLRFYLQAAPAQSQSTSLPRERRLGEYHR